MALVRKSSGAVIKEWTLANSPTLGSVLWGNVKAGMNKRELKAAYPNITDYGYLEIEGAQVRLDKGMASSVEVRKWPEGGKSLAKLLTAKYGPPVELDCKYDSICQGKWAAGENVSAYLSMSWVTYKLASDKAPTGYLVSR